MRSRYLVVTMLSAILFAMFLALRGARSLPEGSISPTDLPAKKAAAGETVEAQVEAGMHTSTKVELATTQGTQRQDGSVILEGRCTQCHTAQMIEQIRQPRADWEKSLAKMETFGVQLDESERAVLLDFLAGDERP